MKYLESQGISASLSKWLLEKMDWCKIRHPAPETIINVDHDELLEFIITGTITVGHFRPTLEELKAATSHHTLKTFVDAALLIDYVCKHGPDVASEVLPIRPGSGSANTVELWLRLCALEPKTYNDQFVIRCHLDKRLLPNNVQCHGVFGRVHSFIRSFCRLNEAAAQRSLTSHAYRFKEIHDLSAYSPRQNDVLKFSKKRPWDDRFTLFAIVTEDNGAMWAEFKPDWEPPLKATQRGLEIFFLRDPDTRFDGFWRKEEEHAANLEGGGE